MDLLTHALLVLRNANQAIQLKLCEACFDDCTSHGDRLQKGSLEQQLGAVWSDGQATAVWSSGERHGILVRSRYNHDM